jgi:two-component system, cell cycle sensor histidine kinase and response regulator CckA
MLLGGKMSNTLEHLQIWYEIAMSIGSSVELRPMLKNSLSILLKKLNCSAGGVLFFQPGPLSSPAFHTGQVIHFEEIFTIPQRIAHNNAYQAALQRLSKTIHADQWDVFSKQLPFCGQEGSGSFFYILELPDVGLLILAKYSEGLDDIILKSLKPILNKLAGACKVCLQNAAMRESDARMQDIIYSVGDWVWEVDENGKYVYSSNKGQDFLGYALKDIIGKTPFDFMPPDEAQRVGALFSEIVSNKAPIKDLENWNIRKNDKRILLLTNGVPILDEKGNLKGYRGVDKDVTDRKRTEDNIRKLSRAVEQSPASVIITNPNGDIEYVNSKFTRLTGYSLEDVNGKNPRILKSGETPNEEYSRLWKTISEGKIWYGELHNKKKNGELYWESASISPILDEKGTVTNFLAIKEDITERKLAEEALRETTDYLENLLSFANAPIMVWDKNHRITRFNLAFERLTGYTMYDVIGKNPEILFAETLNAARSLLSRTSDGEHLVSEEIPLRSKKGDIRLVLWNTANIYDADGKTIIATIAHGQDISERKKAEQALQESELRFRSLYENTTIGLYRTTPDGKIFMANPALVKMLGFQSFQELAERNLKKDNYEPSYQRNYFLELIERDGVVHDLQAKWIQKDGKTLSVLENARAIRDVQGNTLYYDGSVEDITERTLLEEQMRQMQKLESLGTLAGGIAHDFNNILNIILGYSSLLEMRKNQPQKFTESIVAITQAIERGTALVRQIMTFARKAETTFAPVDMHELIRELISMLEQTFPKVITFNAQLNDSLPILHADHSQLHQVFLNLCINARDAMPQGGNITIKAKVQNRVYVRERFPTADQPQYLCIDVADTGEGMDEITRTRIFDPFFTTKKHGKGTGLGLAVVHGIIQAHNGFIDVESMPRQGTVFHLHLPIPTMTKESRQSQNVAETPVPRGTETILLVEDEEPLLDMFSTILEFHGYAILKAGDGKQAIELYQQNQREIDLVVTDMGLPEVTGKDEFKELKKINPNVKVILASGFLEPETKTELLNAGAKSFIQKPYNAKAILRIIREVLDEK